MTLVSRIGRFRHDECKSLRYVPGTRGAYDIQLAVASPDHPIACGCVGFHMARVCGCVGFHIPGSDFVVAGRMVVAWASTAATRLLIPAFAPPLWTWSDIAPTTVTARAVPEACDMKLNKRLIMGGLREGAESTSAYPNVGSYGFNSQEDNKGI